MESHRAESCSKRVLNNTGFGFALGAIGGSVYHFLQGTKDSPNGQRLIGGAQRAATKAPGVGGSWAVWCGLYSALHCTSVHIRQREDRWNSIIAGATASGFLQMRRGLRASLHSAALTGMIFALSDGASSMLHRREDRNMPGGGIQMPPQPRLKQEFEEL